MKFCSRLTSVILLCMLLSFSVHAADVDSQDFYTLEAAEDGRASIISSVATYAGEYSTILSTIATNQHTQSNYLSMIYSYMTGLADWRNSLLRYTANIKDYSSILSSISSGVSSLSDKVATETTLSAISDKVATDTTLSVLSSYFLNAFSSGGRGSTSSPAGSYFYPVWSPSLSSYRYLSWGDLVQHFTDMFGRRGSLLSGTSLYTYVQDLGDVLANAEDRAIRDTQKENQQVAADKFLSGSSSGSSLGKDDFGNLSGVGDTFKDITSLNGQASLSSFTDGLSSADETGQGWFSQATKDALDFVSGSSSEVSTFSSDGDYMEDVDTYNMSGFIDHYSWLWGD